MASIPYVSLNGSLLPLCIGNGKRFDPLCITQRLRFSCVCAYAYKQAAMSPAQDTQQLLPAAYVI
jgi:hypothetical protein